MFFLKFTILTFCVNSKAKSEYNKNNNDNSKNNNTNRSEVYNSLILQMESMYIELINLSRAFRHNNVINKIVFIFVDIGQTLYYSVVD